MNLPTIIAITVIVSLFQFILMWLPFYMDFSDYTNDGKEAIWITKNPEVNWFFTLFLIPHAVMYEHLCERINGNGLAILLLLLSLLTLPVTLLMSLLGIIVCVIRFGWHHFCKAFAREVDDK